MLLHTLAVALSIPFLFSENVLELSSMTMPISALQRLRTARAKTKMIKAVMIGLARKNHSLDLA